MQVSPIHDEDKEVPGQDKWTFFHVAELFMVSRKFRYHSLFFVIKQRFPFRFGAHRKFAQRALIQFL